MGFINDKRVVLPEVWIIFEFGKQYTVGHEFEDCFFGGTVFKTHLTADSGTVFALQLTGKAPCHGGRGDPSGLGAADPAGNAAAEFDGSFGKLGGFSGTGGAA